MLDAIVGVLIAVTATTALVASVQVAESAFDQAGRSPLLKREVDILQGAGYDGSAGSEHRRVLEADLRQLPIQ